jgi:hypothetical protein
LANCINFCRYGDVVTETVLGDIPPADERASQHIAEARLLYRDWTAYWNRHEYWAQAQVRAGWVNVVGLGVERGRTTRISRLSLDGTTNVTTDATWFDGHVSRLFDMSNLPLAFVPGDGLPDGQVQEVTRYLIVADAADYWTVQNNRTGAADNAPGEDRMETSEDGTLRPVVAVLENPGLPQANPVVRDQSTRGSLAS